MCIKNKSQIISIFCLTLFVLITSVDFTYACMCKPNETVDIEYKRTPNVATLKLQRVELLDKKSAGGGNIWHSTFIVEKAFKGNLQFDDKLTFKNEYSSCGWAFSEDSIGTKYLFYLTEKPDKENIWTVSPCSRSGSLKQTAADLLFLENMQKVKDKTRLSGSVTQFIREMTGQGMIETLNYLAGRKVLIVGSGKHIELKTDKNGVYEIYDLPSGKYKITLEKINGYSFTNDNSNTVEVEIKNKSHSEVNNSFSINNVIRGKLYDGYGKPLKDIHLELIPANGDFPLFHIAETYTDERGNFEFEDIPIGTFLIVFNKEGGIGFDSNFETFYYPGTRKREEASEINISAGTMFDNLFLKTPQQLEKKSMIRDQKNKHFTRGSENEQ